MSTRRKIGRIVKRVGVVLTIAWAAALILFFANPVRAREVLLKIGIRLPVAWVPAVPKESCKPYESVAWRLADSVEQYWWHSKMTGIEPLRTGREIARKVEEGKLTKLEPTDHYITDTMWYSFPFAIPETKAFIDTIGQRFRKKLINTDLYGVRLVVTSVLRTQGSVARLLRHNRNAIRNSAHLHGTTFDLSYASYDFKRPVTKQEAEYLREVLAKTLFELRKEKRCWVTYEIFQTCFHVVTR